MWWDDELDGHVVRNVGGRSVDVPLPGLRCVADAVTVAFTVCLDTHDPAPGTPHEWALLVEDAAGLESELVLIEATTPGAGSR